MSENTGAQEKTEEATPRRIREARRKGQVGKSSDLNGALILTSAVLLFYATKETMLHSMERWLSAHFSNNVLYQVETDVLYVIKSCVWFFLQFTWPVFLLVFLVALLVNLMQVGFLFAPDVLTPKPERLNPVNGFKRIFSTRSLVEFGKTIVKVVVVGLVIYGLVKSRLESLILLYNESPAGALHGVTSLILFVLLVGCATYLALAALDFFYQKYEYKKSLRMSKQEVKDEMKHTEGDPLIKSMMRERRRQISMNLLISDVPDATVVVTNPIHYAVALRYEEDETEAPIVQAKGAGYFAERIKDIAREHGIPVIEKPEIARFLFRRVEVGEAIPIELYQAVAEILAMVYRMKENS